MAPGGAQGTLWYWGLLLGQPKEKQGQATLSWTEDTGSSLWSPPSTSALGARPLAQSHRVCWSRPASLLGPECLEGTKATVGPSVHTAGSPRRQPMWPLHLTPAPRLLCSHLWLSVWDSPLQGLVTAPTPRSLASRLALSQPAPLFQRVHRWLSGVHTAPDRPPGDQDDQPLGRVGVRLGLLTLLP